VKILIEGAKLEDRDRSFLNSVRRAHEKGGMAKPMSEFRWEDPKAGVRGQRNRG